MPGSITLVTGPNGSGHLLQAHTFFTRWRALSSASWGNKSACLRLPGQEHPLPGKSAIGSSNSTHCLNTVCSCVQVKPGSSILVTGPNGSGKSSLFRLLGGLWPLTDGEIRKPGNGMGALLSSDIFYVPQKPYTTIGTLREQVCILRLLPERHQTHQLVATASHSIVMTAAAKSRTSMQYMDSWSESSLAGKQGTKSLHELDR